MFDWFYLEKSIATCSLSQEKITYLKNRLVILCEKEDEFSAYEIKDILDEIEHNQLDPIVAGMNYSKKRDIIKHLKKLR